MQFFIAYVFYHIYKILLNNIVVLYVLPSSNNVNAQSQASVLSLYPRGN